MAKKKTTKRKIAKRRVIATSCFYCQSDKSPHYLETEDLSQFITDRAKIIGKEYSGLCSKHQRKLGVAVKRARHLALLPFHVGI